MSDINCTEGEVVRAKSNDSIVYPEVSSCLTLTCVLGNGGMVGAHASHHKRGTYGYDKILGGVRDKLGGDNVNVKKVWILGDLSSWKVNFTPGNPTDPKKLILDTDDESTTTSLEKHIKITLQLPPDCNFTITYAKGKITLTGANNSEDVMPSWS